MLCVGLCSGRRVGLLGLGTPINAWAADPVLWSRVPRRLQQQLGVPGPVALSAPSPLGSVAAHFPLLLLLPPRLSQTIRIHIRTV